MPHPVLLPPATGLPASGGARIRRSLKVHGFYTAISVLMAIFVVIGFWPSYFGKMAAGTLKLPWAMHIHAVVFSGWMVLFLTQASLILRRKTRTHRRLGRYGIAYGYLVLFMGLVATFFAPTLHVRAGEWSVDEAASFLLLPIGDMVLFGTLFTAAILYRNRPEVHKRLILLATVAILFAPVARMMGVFGRAALALTWLSPALLAMGYDLWTRRRVHPAYLAGMAVLLVGFSRVFIMHSEGWLRIGRAIIHALAPGAGA